MEIFPLTIATILSSVLGGFVLGVFYLRKTEASSRDIIYHSLVLGEAFIVMTFLVSSFGIGGFHFLHMIGISVLWLIFTLVSALGAKGGE